MSDTRFTLAGVALVFAGFLVLGVFGSPYSTSTVEEMEFGDCHRYYEDRPPSEADCGAESAAKAAFFAVVVGLIAAGIVALVKGARGRWDQQVRPEDAVGPSGGGGGTPPGTGGGEDAGPPGAPDR